MSIDPEAPARLGSRQRLTLAVLLGAGLMLSVDFSILNVALPRMGEGVGPEIADLPWIASAYAARGRLHPAVRPGGRPVRPPPAVPGSRPTPPPC